MLNNNNPAIRYQYSQSEPDINFCESNSINKVLLGNSHITGLSWQDICSKITNINPEIFFDHVSAIPEVQLSKAESVSENKSHFPCYLQSPIACSEKNKIINFSIKHIHPKFKSKSCRFSKSKISLLKLKSLISKENMKFLPLEVQQNLIHLMPECDRIVEEHENLTTDFVSLSNTSLNNEFFNKALSNFLLRVTKKKSMINIESFINNIRSDSYKSLSHSPVRNSESYIYSNSEKDRSLFKQDRMTIKLDYDFNIGYDKVSKFEFESSSSSINSQINCDNEIPISCKKEEKCSSASSYATLIKFESELNEDFSNTIMNEDPAPFYGNQNRKSFSFNSEVFESSKANKHKRRNSGNATAPTPNKRPTRSTAGQLPARLKSTSPPPVIPSTNTQISHLTLLNKSVSLRSKNKEKKRSKSNYPVTNSLNDMKDGKSNTMNCERILFNLRDKLSKRLQKNCQKYFSDTFSTDESVLNVSPDINYFNPKSPGSLSPGSDKLSFGYSPSSKNSQNNFRQSKLKNSFYENQTPNSPQWSFSSEFTSQSSVESVLSQKNIRSEQEDINGMDNLLEDMDCEEMPPPRRTLTVAAMREKMRAKKMAKEEKRKDVDKDSLLDLDRLNMNKIMDLTVKHSHTSTMSTMMSMPRENPSDETDDENMPNEFDSFMIDDNEIDDYHDDIDDKILNYSDDLDDLLLPGGNESLLEIIMKDPDAMEIANENFCSLNSESQISNTASHSSFHSNNSKNLCSTVDVTVSHPNIFNNSNSNIATATSKNVEKAVISDSSFVKTDNPILLSQTLTSVIQKVSNNIQNSKDVSNIKGSLPNAYLVDGNGLSDALKLIQSLNPGAKVTTQQFYLVNSGPQLILCQTPPTQACSTRPVNSKSPIKSVINTTHIASSTSSSIVTPFIRNVSNNNININSNNSNQHLSNSSINGNSKPSVTSNQSPILSSTISVLPQFSAFNSKTPNLFSVNSGFQNKIITPVANVGCKLSNNVQSTTTISSAGTNIVQQSSIFGNQKSVTTNANTLGIRLQLAQNFQHSQPVSILQSAQNSVIPTIMNQHLQFLSPQPNSNISLITQPQSMSKLVLLCPNLNCQPIGSDMNNSIKADSQQLIFVSPQKEQSNPISLTTNPTFQVLNGPNFWQQINPNFGTILGSANTNNLVLMNPQTLNNQSFSFNYQPQSQIITANNLVIMSSNNFNQSSQTNNQKSSTNNNNHHSKVINNTPNSLTIAVNNKIDEDNLVNIRTQSVSLNLNSNSSQNSCVELLSNSSSSANSKLSFDEKSNCQLSKTYSENLTDSDQEKSINSPSFQTFTSVLSSSQIPNTDSDLFLSAQLADKCKHLTVDIDSLSPSNSVYQNKISTKSTENCLSTSSQNDDSNIIQSPGTDYDQSDFEIPCVYSEKIQIRQNNLINNDENNEKPNDICDS